MDTEEHNPFRINDFITEKTGADGYKGCFGAVECVYFCVEGGGMRCLMKRTNEKEKKE